MADRNEQVLARVREELSRNPDLGTKELFRRAQEVDASIAELTQQQFQGRYVLPVTRERAAARRDTEAGSQPSARASKRRTASPQRRSTRAERPETSRTTAKPGAESDAVPEGRLASRVAIRGVFLQFAREFAEAESRSEIVQVLSRVDDYVEQIVGKAR